MEWFLKLLATSALSACYRRVHDDPPSELVIAFLYDASHVFDGAIGVQHYAYWPDGFNAAGVSYHTPRGFIL